MRIELLILILAVPGACLSTYWAYVDKKTKYRGWLQVSVSILSFISVISAIELTVRQNNLAAAKELTEKNWTIANTSRIESLEFEVLVLDGSLPLDGLREALADSEFVISGVNILDPQSGEDTVIRFSTIFSQTENKNIRRIGRAGADIEINKKSNEIINVQNYRCTASKYYAENYPYDKSSTASICSITAVMDLGRNVTLDDISKSKSIYLRLKGGHSDIKCFGKCENIMLSIRAQTSYRDNQFFKEAVEISPRILIGSPNFAANDQFDYTLSGAALFKLAESAYKRSYGYHDAKPFEATIGLAGKVWETITGSDSKVAFLGEVWTTNAAPTPRELNEAAGESGDNLQQFKERDWCFSEIDNTCWQVFMVVGKINE